MKESRLLLGGFLAAAALLAYPATAEARQGAPHTFTGKTNYSTVTLSWHAPESAKELKWHTDYLYNGMEGTSASMQQPATIYMGSEFTPADLELLKGEEIGSLSFAEYRKVISATALIYEDGKIVREQKVDLANPAFSKGSMRTVKFDEPYKITGDKTIRIAVRLEHGANQDFVAIFDNVANSKGDLYSFDGVNWKHQGSGAFLVTANLINNTDEGGAKYVVYADGKAVTPEAISQTTFSLPGQTDGTHTYKIAAKYGNQEYFTPEMKLTVKGMDKYFASPAWGSAKAQGVDGDLSWVAPLVRTSSNELSWTNSNKTTAIGGTATSNTKVWIKNDFSAQDLLSYVGCEIKQIKAHFNAKEAQQIIIFAMRDNVIVSYDTVPQAQLDAIAANAWSTFTLSDPVAIEAGHSYSYGYYMMHTPKTQPISVDNAPAVGSKSNSFSTSSPNSKDFTTSKPSYKTLASGGIAGNWMMTAVVTGPAAENAKVASYNIYRDGVKVAEGIKTNEWHDVVPAPGRYTYGIEAVGSNGKTSAPFEFSATYALPASYRAPLITESKFDAALGTASFAWSMDQELKHHGQPTYKVGFDEDMSLSWGSKFSAAELADYSGYTIRQLNFIIGDAIADGFTLEVINGEGKALFSKKIAASSVTPLALYSITLDTPIKISGTEDLVLAYTADIKGGTDPIVTDGGPLKDGGAVVKFPGSKTWNKLGTINPTYNNFNIIISAIISEGEGSQSAPRVLGSELAATGEAYMDLPGQPVAFDVEGEGIVSLAPKAGALEPASFNIYCNGRFVENVKERSYVANLENYDVYTYTVTAVYPNGWESPESEPIVVNRGIRQAPVAPFDLNGTAKALTWKKTEEAPVLTYCKDTGKYFGVGMTGTGTRTSYIVNKVPADSLAGKAGMKISHIKFGLFSTDVYTAHVVVFKNFNMVYKQEINVEDLVDYSKGFNEITLNMPVEINEGDEIMYGYLLTYANGIKPMLFDEGPANDGLGNLLSATANDDSWKTLKSMNKTLDGNWMLYATLMAGDRQIGARAAVRAEEGVTFNIYQDGKLFKEGIKELGYTHHEDLPNGDFTVTAVKNGVESAHSNIFTVTGSLTGLEELEAAEYGYIRSAAMILAPEGVKGMIFDANGMKVMETAGAASVASLANGAYIYISADGKVIKFTK